MTKSTMNDNKFIFVGQVTKIKDYLKSGYTTSETDGKFPTILFKRHRVEIFGVVEKVSQKQ